MKSLTAIILVVQKLNFVIQDCGDWRFGRGGEGECTEFCNFSCSPKAAVHRSNWMFWPTISEFNNFILPLKLLIGFFLVNLASNVKMHLCL